MSADSVNQPLLGDSKHSVKSHIPPPPVETFSAGLIGGSDYAALSGFSPDQTEDFPDQVPSSHHKRVIIVGAGIAGIQQAALLLNDGHQVEDIHIFDAMEDFGGTWQKNTYPGCACDVPAFLYTSSFDVNKNWSHVFATRAEIADYYVQVSRRHKLNKCATFRSFVKSCVWNDKNFVWQVTVQSADTQELSYWTADVLCQCVGQLDRPKFGTTPGRENFKGESWHTAYWPKEAALKGKRVAIIGCGPSAAQVIPAIVDEVEHLTVYMRTPPIVLPRPDRPYSRLFMWANRWIPGFAYINRQIVNFQWIWKGTKAVMDNSLLNNMITKRANKFLEEQVQDPELRKILTPHSKFMCKRPLILSTLYPAFSKSNCTVLREKLVRYTENGVVSVGQVGGEIERPYDIIIFGTGFNVSQYLEHERIIGLNGINLQDQWRDHPEALYGLAVSNFPNMFMCVGPNTSQQWSSPQDVWECQARLCVKAVREIMRRERRGIKMAMFPHPERERAYNDEVQRLQRGFVWSRSDCVTYYKTDSGWLTFTMPYSLPQFWWMVRTIKWKEWVTLEK